MTDNKDIQLELDQFTDQFKSLMIASLTKDLMPYTSYAPFIKYEQSYYFIISKIAKHYENLMHHSKASIMFIEDESNASHIFFRKRLSYLIDTSIIESNRNVKQTFIDVFGHFINQLFSMDFVI